MGAEGIVRLSKGILLLANGPRKTEAIARSLLGEVTPDVPISILQQAALQGKEVRYILDEKAAIGIIGKESILNRKGIKVERV